MSALKPLADRVVMQTVEAETKTASGIILPDAAKEKPKEATVVAVGPDVKIVKKGDTVIYEEFAGTTVKVGTEEYVIAKEEKILAKVGK